SLAWTLVGPRGTEVSQRGFANSDSGNIGSPNPVLNLLAGNYTLMVGPSQQGSADHTGSYSFRLSDLASATAISPSTVVSGTLNPGNSTNAYQFSASSGDLFYFDMLSGGGGNQTWRLIDPNGQQVWYQNLLSVPNQTLGLTGTYTLLVEGYISSAAP